MQTSSYVLGCPPNLPATLFENAGILLPPFTTISEAETRLVEVLHSCYHFNARASPLKYLPRASITPDIIIGQGRHIANLSQWLEILDHDVLAFQPGAVQKLSKTHSRALILRAQCFNTVIYASTVLYPDETSYDFHGPRFRRIIEDVAIAL